ncbi:uncharacterized protein BT62DRAFT_725662 [Guyanagaster necrorhizus]|uniref:Uncharacterized protein n=1 Tax=Guyanagaster necrorhizus TaxID=856835 RepID=A0A9P7VWD5_9AGAR|nr:uncharacterized protein BT62DRAFT_725662 [Guyanagaster necrorhizus MCA 3950]KAG7448756.1 hypothetical protein BT62DRAFT_725662 [Guyanagaster necrorhizus MCA 3950]
MITCHVDMVETNKDAAQEPYATLSNLPNFIGFHKCFPNITQIFLESRYSVRGRWFLFVLSQGQIIRTRISITLGRHNLVSYLWTRKLPLTTRHPNMSAANLLTPIGQCF